MKPNLKQWMQSGTPWIWLNAAAVSTSLLMVFGLLWLIAIRGFGFFWPSDVFEMQYQAQVGKNIRIIGEVWDSQLALVENLRANGVTIETEKKSVMRYLLKSGNRDVSGADFQQIIEPFIVSKLTPENILVVERSEWGNLYGYLKTVKQQGKIVAQGEQAITELDIRLKRSSDIRDDIDEIAKGDIGAVNYAMENLRLKQRRLEINGDFNATEKQQIDEQRATLQDNYNKLQQSLIELNKKLARDSFTVEIMDGQIIEVPLSKVIRISQPNSMSLFSKVAHYLINIKNFIFDDPREANTEGGVFPAIFGTIMMVIIMAILVTPLGVIAAVYLREYAKQGPIIRTIRIAVNNLAGVPSIVYGIFGLGFFVYFLGGNLDQLFFPEALPAPTFGTPGLIWASLTLAIMTLPVVIVSTEEGLSRIPRSIREGSLALGATKFETLWRTVIPMSSPSIMTGLILAVARAAGEVAPLMLVGVVKLAPSLPLDGNFPFLHLERKFMHLGFHIYDVGFQSPNVEAARPLVYATALLLVIVIIALNLLAIRIRNNLREKYKSLEV
ncbi:Phosphate transport system permease protein PstA (TC 3.A.1.7.1) [hydrothermal vent metagenome]|uniref:Phosphate transport system permease protein PstA (TC 3.A.1.7.1) n=1 Tax=hydrothermal vent metagenome TaxID=652676 RepID=A0A3B1AX09_9ZZZZ